MNAFFIVTPVQRYTQAKSTTKKTLTFYFEMMKCDLIECSAGQIFWIRSVQTQHLEIKRSNVCLRFVSMLVSCLIGHVFSSFRSLFEQRRVEELGHDVDLLVLTHKPWTMWQSCTHWLEKMKMMMKKMKPCWQDVDSWKHL